MKQGLVKELSDILENKSDETGAPEVDKILDEIKGDTDVYYDEYSCIGSRRPTLDQKGHEGIKRIIEAEMVALRNCDARDLTRT